MGVTANLTQRGEDANEGNLDRMDRIYRMLPLCILSILLIPSKKSSRENNIWRHILNPIWKLAGFGAVEMWRIMR